MRRNKTITIPKVLIKQANKDDALRGWVRIPENIREDIENASFIKIEANRKYVFCQVRGTTCGAYAIEINEHFRNLLGVKAEQEIDVKVTKIEWVFGKLRAIAMHPEHMVRFGLGLSLLGVTLGSIALVISLLPYAIRQTVSPDGAWAGWVTLVVLLGVMLFVVWVISIVINIFRDKY